MEDILHFLMQFLLLCSFCSCCLWRAQFIKYVPFSYWGEGGYFWEVVVGVYRPALLILTPFQSNIYKVNVRESPPRRFMSSKWIIPIINLVTIKHVKRKQPSNAFEASVLCFFIVSFKRFYEYLLGSSFTFRWSWSLLLIFFLSKLDCNSFYSYYMWVHQ